MTSRPSTSLWRWTAGTSPPSRRSARASTAQSCGCSCRGVTSPTPITAGQRASSAYSTWSKPPAPGCCAKLPALLPSFHLLQLLFLRSRLRPFAPRAAELLRVLRWRGDRLAAIGFDHHQARAFQKRPGIDFRLIASHRLVMTHDRFFMTHDRFFVARRRRLGSNRFIRAGFLGPQRFFQALGLAPLIFADRFVARLLMARRLARRDCRSGAVSGVLLVPARTIAAMAPTAASLLVGPGLVRSRLLGSGVLRSGLLRSRLLRSELVRHRLLGPRLLLRSSLMLRPRLLLPLLLGPAIAPVRPLTPLAAGLAIAPLLQTPLLLSVPMLVAGRATVAPAVAPIPSLLIGSLIAPRLLIPPLLLLVPSRLRMGLCRGLRNRLRLRGGRRRLEDAEEAREKAFRSCGRGGSDGLQRRQRRGLHWSARRLGAAGRPRLRFVHHRCGLRRGNGFDDGFLPLALGFFLGAGRLRLLGALDHLVARGHVLHLVQLVVPQALHLVVRRLQVRVGHQHDVHLQAAFELLDLAPFLVQQERGHVDRHLCVHRAGVLLHRLLLHDAQHVQGGGLGAPDEAGAAAARAVDVRRLLERGLQPLARELHHAEARNLADLHPRPVVAQRLAQPVLDLALVSLRLHVDEIDDDEAP